MGITLSHTAYSPLSMASTVIGFVSFTFTLLTLLKVFWTNLGTFGGASHQIPDYLSQVKQGLLEERRHLRRARRRLRSLRKDYPGIDPPERNKSTSDERSNYLRRTSRSSRRKSRTTSPSHDQHIRNQPPSHFARDTQSFRSDAEASALRVLRQTMRDLITSFREIEAPFLKPQLQAQDSAHWSTNYSSGPNEKRPHSNYFSEGDGEDDLDDDSPVVHHMHRTNRLGSEYRKVGFRERWLWVRRKAQVEYLDTVLSRVEIRRTAHEVGEILSVVCHLGEDMEDMRKGVDGLEGRLGRVVGVRRVN